MPRQLVIVDHLDCTWFTAALSPSNSGEWDVLLWGLNEVGFREKHADELERLGHWRILDLREKAQLAHRQVREFLVPFIHELPKVKLPHGKQVGDWLVSGEEHWWWFLEISEKSSMRSAFVNQLYYLSLLRVVLQESQYDEIWVDIASHPLRRVLRQHSATLPRLVFIARVATRKRWRLCEPTWLRYWTSALRNFVRVFTCTGILAVGGIKRTLPEAWSLLFFSVFPSWWLKPFSPSASERFFPGLPSRHQGIPFRYAVWLDCPLRQLWRERGLIRAALHRNRMISLQALVNMRAMVGLLSPKAFSKVEGFLRGCRKYLKSRFVGFDVTSLVIQELERSLASDEFFRDRLLVCALRRLTASVPIRALVYRAECQPIERALLYGVRGRAQSVGCWHSALALASNYVRYQFVPGEFQGSLAGAANPALPLPDAMLATGAICVETLVRQGYPSNRIAVCGPVRYRELLTYLASRESKWTIRRRLGLHPEEVILFVAASADRVDSEGLLASLGPILDDLGPCRVVIKLHPAMVLNPTFVESVLERLGKRRAFLCPSDANIYDYIAASDAILLAGSTIAFEAMALGVMPIVVENTASFCASSLADFAEACFVVRSVGDLRQAVRDTLSRSEIAEAKRSRWPSLLQRIFHDLGSDPRPSLIAALERLGIIRATLPGMHSVPDRLTSPEDRPLAF